MKRNDRHAIAIQVRLAQQFQNSALRACDTIRRHAARRIDCENKQGALLVFQQLVTQRLRINGCQTSFKTNKRTQRRVNRNTRTRIPERHRARVPAASLDQRRFASTRATALRQRLFFALVSREGYTVHDRFTRTAVVTS